MDLVQDQNSGKGVVIALDIGTTYSGWAYSFRDKPDKVYTRHWDTTTCRHDGKTSTCVLIKPDGKTIEEFGDRATQQYQDLYRKGKHEEYFFFQTFKMGLYQEQLNEGLNRKYSLKDFTGKPLPAINVFACVIQHLVEDARNTLNQRYTVDKKDKGKAVEANGEASCVFLDSQIQWVLTVPAIWTDGAKQIMMEAVRQAGVETVQVVLEPEAASMYCRHLEIKQNSAQTGVSKFQTGTKYMIVDAGGGTVDITVHEVASEKQVYEIVAASGGRWGSHAVNVAFLDFLKNLCGEEVFESLADDFETMTDLNNDVELKKKVFSQDKLILQIGSQLSQAITENHPELLRSSGGDELVVLRRDKLEIKGRTVSEMFEATTSKIVEHIQSLLRKDALSDLEVILMVGGFSDCRFLQEKVRERFPNISLVIPDNAGLCVLKGAVLLGHFPAFVSRRVMKYTYGTAKVRPFQPGDPINLRCTTNKGVKCLDAFHKFVEIDQTVEVGKHMVQHQFSKFRKEQLSMLIPVYASLYKNPGNVHEDGCILLGNLVMPYCPKDVEVRFEFGSSMLQVSAYDTEKKILTSIELDFLIDRQNVNSGQEKEHQCEPSLYSISPPKTELASKYLVVVLDIGGTNIRDFAFWLDKDVHEDIPGLLCRNCALIERGSKLKTIALLGLTAEERILETKKDDCLIFFSRTIKYMLYTDLNVKDSIMQDDYGETVEARDVFTAVLSELLSLYDDAVRKCEIQLVLTIPVGRPTVLTDFMKTAAKGAGMVENQILVIPKLEAAVRYVHHQFNTGSRRDEGIRMEHSNRFMAVHAGGVSVDVAVYDVIDKVDVTEFAAASQTIMNGKHMTAEITQFIEKFVGKDVLKEFTDTERDDYGEFEKHLMDKIETIGMEMDICIRLPLSLRQHITDRPIRPSGVRLNRDKLVVSQEEWLKLSRNIISRIMDCIQSFVAANHVNVGDLTGILIVGGFSKCKLFQETIRASFPGTKIYVPDQPTICAVHGAHLVGRREALLFNKVHCPEDVP